MFHGSPEKLIFEWEEIPNNGSIFQLAVAGK